MLNAHDIVVFDIKNIEKQELIDELSLSQKVFGVVRRSIVDSPDLVPIGLRGKNRNQRYSQEVSIEAIEKVIHPWELVNTKSFREKEISEYSVYQEYLKAKGILADSKWGIGGSLGFELASEIAAVKETSDFDLLIFTNSESELPINIIKKNSSFFEKLDTQIVSQRGGFSLKEYLHNPEKKILLKTNRGPKLTKEIW